MKTKRLASPQTVNACTLISVAVIEAILSARNEKEMDSKIKEAHKSSQMLYIEQLSHNKERGAGLLEEEAYQQYFSEFFKNPTTAVIAPNEINIKELLDNRDNLIRNGIFDLFLHIIMIRQKPFRRSLKLRLMENLPRLLIGPPLLKMN